MGHWVTFEKFSNFTGLFSEQDVIDLIEVFYRWGDARFHVIGEDDQPGRRGSHRYNGITKLHTITLSRPNIEEGVRTGTRMGGTGKAPNARVGVAMVLTHELQHANQSMLHSHGEIFYTTARYDRRPCERDARSFVDSNMDTITSIIEGRSVGRSVPAMDNHVDPISEVLDLFQGFESTTVEDVTEELRLLGACNPRAIDEACLRLRAAGTSVST